MREYLDLAMPFDGVKYMQRLHEELMLLRPILSGIEQLFYHHLCNEPRWDGVLDGFSSEVISSEDGASIEIAGKLYLLGDKVSSWQPASAFIGLSPDRKRVAEYDLACVDAKYGLRISESRLNRIDFASPRVWAFAFRWQNRSLRRKS